MKKIRAIIKKITDTNNQKSTNNAFMVSPCKLGGLGITASYDDYQVQNVVQWLNFQIVTTKDNYSDTWWTKVRTSIDTLNSKFHTNRYLIPIITL